MKYRYMEKIKVQMQSRKTLFSRKNINNTKFMF